MRIIKKPEIRRNEILDAAGELFGQKGFDAASTNDILAKAGIARGTLYYHFKSKEDIMDALIARQSARMLTAAKKIAEDKEIPLIDRLVQTVLAMNIEDQGPELLEHIHAPQNAMMHQKIQASMLKGLTPILADIVREGVAEGLFDTPYPYECMEMVTVYAATVFDSSEIIELTQEEAAGRILAMSFHIERMLGTTDGCLTSAITQMFQKKGGHMNENK